MSFSIPRNNLQIALLESYCIGISLLWERWYYCCLDAGLFTRDSTLCPGPGLSTRVSHSDMISSSCSSKMSKKSWTSQNGVVMSAWWSGHRSGPGSRRVSCQTLSHYTRPGQWGQWGQSVSLLWWPDNERWPRAQPRLPTNASSPINQEINWWWRENYSMHLIVSVTRGGMQWNISEPDWLCQSGVSVTKTDHHGWRVESAVPW